MRQRRGEPGCSVDETVAALYVAKGGCYTDLPGVDPWTEERDARLYPGPWPVVAHPPCSRWCRLAGLVEARWGHKKGDDGGTFKAALDAVHRWGGVLEHPAYSDAWQAFGLIVPPPSGGWVRSVLGGGWCCQVEQGRYGHPARKATWIYCHGTELPTLRWGSIPNGIPHAVGWRDSRRRKGRTYAAIVGHCKNNTDPTDTRPRISKRQASATPPEFRDVLIGMARSVYRERGK